MQVRARRSSLVPVLVLSGLLIAAAGPAEAQRECEPLIDKFNFNGEISWVGLSTEIALFNQELETGGTLNSVPLGAGYRTKGVF